MSTKKFTMIASVLFALSVIVTPAFAACDLAHLTDPVICDQAGLLELAASLGATNPTTTTTTGSISGIPAGFQFTQTLKQGSTGTQVKYLQILLNSDSATAVGNAGNETSYFGSMTKAAVNKFQTKYASEILAPLGLTAPTGTFGAASRAKANALLAGGVVPPTGLPAGCTSTSGYSTTTGLPCSSGTLPAGCTSTSGYSPLTGQKCDSGSTIPVTGGFSIRLATDNPAAGTFVQGQATADLAHYTFSNATSSAVVVTGVELTRIGISADATLSNVYLFDGAIRITDAASVSTGKITFNATSGIFTIPANSTKTITVKSDLAGGSNGQTIGVSLSGVTSNGTLSSTLPIAGNLHNIASATLAGVTIANVLPGGATTTDPVAGVRIWESTFTVTNRNVQFTKLTLKQINSIENADLSNFKLLIDGAEVATVASLDSNKYVTFTFDKTLVTGSRNVKVLADVNGGSSRYIQMSLRNKADVDVRDSEYSVNVAVIGAPATASTLQVNQGVFTITNKNAALPITVANSASNTLIGKWAFKATGEAVKVETLTAGFNYVNAGFAPTVGNPANGSAADIASEDTCNGTYTHSVNGVSNSSCAGAAATLRNGKLMINGVQAGSTATLVPAGTPYTVNYTFQPGVETMVELYADVYDNDGLNHAGIIAADTIQSTLVVGNANGTKQISLGTINVPTAAQAASSVLSTITVAQGAATVVATPNYGTPQNTVIPRTAFKVGSWTATGSTAEDINVNNLSFAIAAQTDNSFEVGDMYDMYVVYKVGSNAEVTSSIRPTPATPADFPVSFTLPRTQTATIDLYASLLDNGLNDAAGAEAITSGDAVQATLTITGTGSQSGAAAAFGAPKAGQVIVYQGASLTVTKDASTPVATLVAANNTVQTASYKFEAANDTYDVVKLVYNIGGIAADASAVSMVNLKDGSTIIQSQPAAATVTFTGFTTPITITSGVPKILDVELVLGSVGTGAGNTGSAVTVDLVGGSSLVRPSSTGAVAAFTDPASGNVMYAYKAVPNITLTTLPTSVLTQGTNTIAKFTVGTNGTGTVGWKKMVFKVTKTDASGGAPLLGALTNATLWDASTNTQINGTAVIPAATLGATDTQTGNITFYPDTEEQISGSKTYVLKVTVGATVSTGDSIVTMIENPGAATGHANSATAFAIGTNTGAATYAYSDEDGNNTVTQNDVRQTYVPKMTIAVTGTNNDTLVLGNPSGAYGIADGTTVVFTTTNSDGTGLHDGLTVASSDATLTCTPNTLFTDTINTVTCASTAGTAKSITFPVAMTSDNVANTDTVTITVDGTLYAANTVVGANNSDLNIGLTAGTPRTASFVWSDLSTTGHSLFTADWTDDYLVRSLPTDTQNLTK